MGRCSLRERSARRPCANAAPSCSRSAATRRRETRARDLPHVDRRLVEIARALATRPDVLLLDEPAAGLSQDDKARVGDLLRSIADGGIGVVLVEHDMGLVMRVCDRIVVLDAGQPLATGTPAEIRADPRVRDAYLGEQPNGNSAPRWWSRAPSRNGAGVAGRRPT